MGEDVAEGASSRGAAGGDIRFGEVPQELVEACHAKLEDLIAPFGLDLGRCEEILLAIEGGLAAFTKLI